MGKYLGNQLHPIEWAGSLAWAAYCGALAYKAISERSITLGGRLGISHTEGLAAVLLGFVLLGSALVGVSWLLRVHALKRLLYLFLFLGWLGSAVVYILFFYP